MRGNIPKRRESLQKERRVVKLELAYDKVNHKFMANKGTILSDFAFGCLN